MWYITETAEALWPLRSDGIRGCTIRKNMAATAKEGSREKESRSSKLG